MRYELPAKLRPTADMLRNSLMLRTDERAPAIPDSLYRDLSDRFHKGAANPAPTARIPLLARIQRFLSTPAFGMAAAALVILAAILPSVLKPSGGSGSSSFRGGTAVTGEMATHIVLIGASQALASSLGESGYFEKGSILTSDTAPGSKVLVDFNISTITAISADGETVHSSSIPTDPTELPAAIAEAFGKL